MIRLKMIGITGLSIVGVAATVLVILNKEVGSKLKSRHEQGIRLKKDTFIKTALLLTEQYEKACQQSARNVDLLTALATERDAKVLQTTLLDKVIPAVRKDLKTRFNGKIDPNVIWIVDTRGRISALDRDREEYEKVLTSPLVKAALGGASGRDLWLEKIQSTQLFRVVASPVYSDKAIVGALLFGFALGKDTAHTEAKAIGADILYFTSKFVRGSSIEQTDDSEMERFLTDQLARLTFRGANPAPETLILGGRLYLALAALYPEVVAPSAEPPTTQFGYVLLSSVDDEVEGPLSSFRMRAIIAALGYLVIAIVLTLMAVRSFIQPIERIEQGVLEIIEGNREVRFRLEGMGECATLAYQMNQLIASLTGRPAPDDGDETDGWTDPLFIDELAADEQDALIGGGELAQDFSGAKGAVPTDEYYKRLFDDYIAARKSLGEKVEAITLVKFRAKLRKNEEALMKKYKCQAIKFQVQIKDGKVTLRPLPIK